MSSKPKTKVRAVSAKTLSSYGYSVCFFPEQPTRQIIVEEPEEHVERKVVQKVEAATPKEAPPELVRLYWRNRLVYLLAFISFSLSLNNIYHFPINIYRYGETFFIPYTVSTIVVGYPMHALQTSMGQYSQRGPLWVWECAPLCFGVGFAMLLACIIMSLYYNMYAAYALVYSAHCLNTDLPWTYCSDVSWNFNTTCAPGLWQFLENDTPSSKDYFYNIILNTPYRHPPESWSMGSFKWWLFLSLICSWVFVYIATLRSCRSIGKFAIIMVIFSYFTILSLLIVAVQVKGSGKLLVDDTKRSFLNVEMWCTAVMQVLLELGISYGIPVVYGSYCRFRNFLHTDSIILCIMNYLHSVIFFYLFFAFGHPFSCDYKFISWDIPDQTIGVIYIIYSYAFSTVGGSNYWCVLFFFMLFLIIIGTQIAVVEAIMTALYDNFPNLSKGRWFLNILICGSFLIFGFLFCFSNGYFGTLVLHYIPTLFCLLPLSCFFIIGIVFVYGFNRYSENMKTMRDYNLTALSKFFLFILIIIFILMMLIVLFTVHSIMFAGNIDYDESYIAVAWVICFIIICSVVLCGIMWIIYRLPQRRRITKPSNNWETLETMKKNESGQFTRTYRPSYTWEWNKYE